MTVVSKFVLYGEELTILGSSRYHGSFLTKDGSTVEVNARISKGRNVCAEPGHLERRPDI